jgi:SAM-dependent methyltransferase
MNWKYLRLAPWLDTRIRFVQATPANGSLLDIGSSNGETLSHMAELRPDLRFFAADLAGHPEKYPSGCQFHRGDIQTQKLPWPDASIDTVTCIHLVEHLQDLKPMMQEVARLLRPGGRAYFETPHPKSLQVTSVPGSGFPLNFHDDTTHVRVVPVGELASLAQTAGLRVAASGISRNWLFAGSHLWYAWQPGSRKKYTAYLHWIGWSAYLIVARP